MSTLTSIVDRRHLAEGLMNYTETIAAAAQGGVVPAAVALLRHTDDGVKTQAAGVLARLAASNRGVRQQARRFRGCFLYGLRRHGVALGGNSYVVARG